MIAARGNPEVVEQPLDVSGVFTHRDQVRGDRALAEAPQVGREHAEAVAQRGELGLPQGAVERVAMDQDHAVTAASIVVGKPDPGERSRRMPAGASRADQAAGARRTSTATAARRDRRSGTRPRLAIAP
jgi:hypothetical protein